MLSHRNPLQKGEVSTSGEQVCNGTIISRQQYLIDVNERGYRDARLEPLGNMSEEEIAEWTKGIEVDGTK